MWLRLNAGSTGCPAVMRLTRGPMKDLVADGDSTDVAQRAVLIDEDVAADADVDALVRVHRWDQPKRRIDLGVRQLRPRGAKSLLDQRTAGDSGAR